MICACVNAVQSNLLSDVVYIANKAAATTRCQTTMMAHETVRAPAGNQSDLGGASVECFAAIVAQDFGPAYMLANTPGLAPAQLIVAWEAYAGGNRDFAALGVIYNDTGADASGASVSCADGDDGNTLLAVFLPSQSLSICLTRTLLGDNTVHNS